MTGCLELPLAFHGHIAKLQVSPIDEGGWDVRTAIDGHDVAHVRCDDWDHVERFRSRVQMRLRADGLEGLTEWAAPLNA